MDYDNTRGDKKVNVVYFLGISPCENIRLSNLT